MNTHALHLGKKGLLVLVSLFMAAFGKAQDTTREQVEVAATPAEASSASETAPRDAVWRLPFLPGYVDAEVTLSNVFDSNIDHSQTSVTSYGFVPGLGVRYQNRRSKPTLTATYAVARHVYTHTDTWDRVSHVVRAEWTPRLARRWYTETVGEISLGGTSEDRDLSNQYTLRQEVEYRLTRDNRLHGYATAKVKRVPGDTEAVFKPNVGFVFERKLSGERTWEAGVRYEVNRAATSRSDYVRWTFDAEYELPLFSAKDRLEMEVKYRRKRYDARFIEIEGEDALRRDYQWVLGMAWERLLVGGLETVLSYQFEMRDSNDPEKFFNAHLLGLALVYDL